MKSIGMIFVLMMQSHSALGSTYYCGSQLVKIIRHLTVAHNGEVNTAPESLKQLLLNAVEKQPIEVHQNGHLRINIQIGGQRFDLHIHMRKPIVTVEGDFRMHDHVFDLHSYILFGQLEDANFSLESHPEGKYFIVRTESRDGRVAPENNHSVYEQDDRRFNLVEFNRTSMAAGHAYWLKRGVVHESKPLTPEVVTITQRIFHEVSSNPIVLGPVGSREALERRMRFDRQGFDHGRARQIASELISAVNSAELWAGLSRWVSDRVELRTLIPAP